MGQKLKRYYEATNRSLTTIEPLRIGFNIALMISILTEVWNLSTSHGHWNDSHYTAWFGYGVPDVIYSLFVGYCLATRYGVFAAMILAMSTSRYMNYTKSVMVIDSSVCLFMLLSILFAVVDQNRTHNEMEMMISRRKSDEPSHRLRSS